MLTTTIFFFPDDSWIMDKKVIIIAMYIGLGFILLAALVAGGIALIIWHLRQRQHQRVFAVADGNILSDAIQMLYYIISV